MAGKKRNAAVELAPEADPRAPLDSAVLLSKAQGLLAELEADLLVRARGSAPVQEALRLRHGAERAARRTADPLEVWERHFVTQVAASWVLSCVFVRTLEDRGLLGHNRIAGPGAADSQRLFFEVAPSLTEREYLLTIFRELTRLPAARELFDARHNPVWLFGPSAELAKKLLALFRAPDAEAPSFRFGQADTRFLGDLYQDLSADVRERFALLQTPHFIEKYILDRTLDRAIARFGLDDTTLIDPTCGSGHFLLGAFDRLFEHRLRKEPGLDARDAARLALDAVCGADINPYAVAIARFRLTITFLEKAGHSRLADAPTLPLHVVVADSLLHNLQHMQAKLGELSGQSMRAWSGDEFALEDEAAASAVLHRRFAAVVGNPPFITVKDAVLKERYRELYSSCFGDFTLATPLAQRFFQLARAGGFVGFITENGFMKRTRGRRLIEEFLPTINLDGVVNTSGVPIPGHGTPTVLLFGANEPKRGSDVLTVLANRGEPNTNDDPALGEVWQSIADHGGEVGFVNDYISVAHVPRTILEEHPWPPLSGGGAAELKGTLEQRAQSRLKDLVAQIGFASFSGEDDVFIAPSGTFGRQRVSVELIRTLVKGEDIRDWGLSCDEEALVPYDLTEHLPAQPKGAGELEYFWRYRSLLSLTRSGRTKTEGSTNWWEWYRWIPARYAGSPPIAYAYVATHGNFVRGAPGQVFRGGASVAIIKLKQGGTEEDHLALLAYLNSSTACFWMKQVAQQKTVTTGEKILQSDPAKIAYEFAASVVAALPVPEMRERHLLVRIARELARLQSERARLRTVVEDQIDSALLMSREQSDERLLRRSVALQELLDLAVYRDFGLATADSEHMRVLADATFRGEFDATPSERTFLSPANATRTLLAAELANVASDAAVLIETPNAKRRWVGTQGRFAAEGRQLRTELEAVARRLRLLQIERSFTTSEVQRRGRLPDMLALDDNHDGVQRLSLPEESVAFLAAYRHSDTGLEKRAEWERVWDLQRAEDRGERVPPFEPPPKYDQKDYRDTTSWRLRGKLDVPKERFISYPGCESDEDKEPVYGWAGWNHLQQAQALAALYQTRKTEEGWGKERLTPMLAGILELVPWVKQWHNEPSAEFGGLRLGDYFETFLDGECHALGLARQELRAWRPAEKGRAKKAQTEAAPAADLGVAAKPKGRRRAAEPGTADGQ